MVTSANLISGS